MGRQPWRRRGLLVVIGLCASVIISGTLISSSQWIQQPFPGFFLHENMSVGPYFLPPWTGRSNGVNSFDHIVGIDGQPVSSRERVYNLVKGSPPGSSFRYEVIRDSRTIEVTVPSMVLSLQDWFLCFGVFVLVGIAFLIIGAAPYYYHASSPGVLPLCFMVVNVFLWFATTFDFMATGIVPRELRIFAFTLTPSAGVHLGLLLKKDQPLRSSHPVYLAMIYGISLVLGMLYRVTFFDPAGAWTIALRAGYVYSCLSALVFLGVIWSALRGPLADIERSRLRVIFGGAILGFFIPTFAAVLTTSFRWPIPHNLALIPTVFFPLSVAYGLLKYSLFDLGNALKVGLSRVALTVFLLAMYVAIVFLLGTSVGLYDKDPLIPILFSVLVVFLFNPLLRWIEGIVDRYIDRQEYEPAKIRKEVSLFLRSLAQTQALADGFLARVAEPMGIKTAILIYRPQGASGYVATTTGAPGRNFAAVAQTVCSLWDEGMESRYQAVSRGEASSNPTFLEKRSELLKVFDELGSEILVPIVFEREARGVVSFGPKPSGRDFTADDLTMLATLTDQLALSLENAGLYEESEKSREKYQRLYDEAELVKKRLIEGDRAKKQFVANICHELRTPISTIIGYSEVLLDPSFGGDARAVLERLVNNGQDLSQLMDNLLDFSRMEAGAVFNRLEPVSVKEVLGGLEVMTQRLIRGRPIQFKVNVESAIDTIQSDPRKLQQILVQLLTNALKFTEKGEIELRLRTLPYGDRGVLEISISDTGIGIDERDLEVIFEEFRQLDGSSTRQYGGTGLGLSLCKKLAQALGGQITVASRVGMGSVFSLLLPIQPPQPQIQAMG